MARRIFLKEGGLTGSVPSGYKALGFDNLNQIVIDSGTGPNKLGTYLSNVSVTASNLVFTSLGDGFSGTISLSSLSATGGSGDLIQYLNLGSSSVTSNIDLSAAKTLEIYTDNNPTFTFSNPVVGFENNLLIKQDRPKRITWPTNIIWRGNSSPSTLSAFTYFDITFSIGTGFNAAISDMKLQSDGNIVLGGAFTSYNSTTRNRIIRITSTGSLDSSFNIGTGFNGTVTSIELQSDGKLVIGGAFTTYNGATYSRIIRLNSDGSPDSTFFIGNTASITNNGFNTGQVSTVQIQSDGKIICAGSFTAYRGTTINRIARLTSTASLDNIGSGSYSVGTGFNNTVNTMRLQPDGKLVVGGIFTTYNGVTYSRITRLNTDGRADNTFFLGATSSLTNNGLNGTASSLLIDTSNRIIVGGQFTTYTGATSNSIVRLSSTGSRDSNFSTEVGNGYNGNVISIATQSNNKLIFGGAFTQYQGITSSRISRIESNASIDETFSTGTGFGAAVNSVIVQPDGKILVAGAFTTFNGVTRNYIARLDQYSQYYLRVGLINNGTNYIGTY